MRGQILVLLTLFQCVGAGLKPCINLFSRVDELEQRCEPNLNCEGQMDVVVARAENRQGNRLVGNGRHDAFKCYPLSNDDLWRSLEASPGNFDRVRQVSKRARAKETIRVVVLGGSVTNGGGCESYALPQSKKGKFGQCSWGHRFVQWMRHHFSNPHIALIPLCQPATTSVWILAHLNRVLESNPDVVLVDYAVNDALYGEHDAAQRGYWAMMRAANERLIRRILEHKTPFTIGGPGSPGQHPALMYLAIQRSWENSSYPFPHEVYEPVCRQYNVPLVSIRDAVWPDVNVVRNPHVWETVHGAHPTWKGHQLIADVLAFVWTAAEATVASTHENVAVGEAPIIPHESRQPPRPHSAASPFHFSSAEATALDVCPNGVYLSPQIGSAERLAPSRVGAGWAWHDQNGKAGWQYALGSDRIAAAQVRNHATPHAQELSPSSTRRRRLRAIKRKKQRANADSVLRTYVQSGQAAKVSARTPLTTAGNESAALNTTSAPQDGLDAPFLKPPAFEPSAPLPGIISFPLRFHRAHPGLLVEFIKSYNSFGQAVVWVTTAEKSSEGAVVVAAAVEANATTTSSPPQGKEEEEKEEEKAVPPHVLASAKAALSLAWLNKKFVDACKLESSLEHHGLHRRVNGSPDCSLIMAGSWNDPSVLEGHWGDRSTQVSTGARSGGLTAVRDKGMPGKDWVVVLNETAPFFDAFQIFFSGEEPSFPSTNEDVADAEVHFMMVPWSDALSPDRKKFKIMGLESC